MLNIYKASAGSGKTHTLTREYLLMLFRDYQKRNDGFMPHSHILAVTFTKKATAEMKERILQALYTLSQSPKESPFYKDITKAIKINEKEVQKQAQKLLIGVLQDYNRFAVSTIDGFFQQVVRTFALDLGLSATYDLSLDGKEIMLQAVDSLFQKTRSDDPTYDDLKKWITDFTLQNINDSKNWNPHDMVRAFSGELLKEQLIREMGQLKTFFADKEQLKAYKNQLQKICKDIENEDKTIKRKALALVADFESINTRAIGGFTNDFSYLLENGLSKTFRTVLDNPESLITKKAKAAEKAAIESVYDTELKSLYEQLVDLCDNKLKDYRTAKSILKNLYKVGLLQDIAQQVEHTNREMGRVPISDVNMLIHRVIDGQETPFIYERMGQYLHHFMIDEFQDTSALQWDNFLPLIREAESSEQDNLIVGDVKQSIYRWRNSDWRLLNEVDKVIANSRQPKMGSNWRSAKTLIEQNEWVMQAYREYLVKHLANKGWDYLPLAQTIKDIYSYEAIHQQAEKNLPGVFHMEFFQGNKDNVEVLCMEAVEELLQSLVAEGINLGRVAMLTREKDDIAKMARYLIEKGHKVQSAEGLRIQSHSTVKLLVALMQREVDKENEVIQAIIDDILILTEEQEEAIRKVFDLPLYEMVQALINLLQLDKIEGALPYLTAFQDRVYQFTQERVADMTAFLEYWEGKKDTASIPSSTAQDAIQLLTIHSSKGLEFDIVILPFLTWPLQKDRKTDIIWCKPKLAPYDQLPLVAISPSKGIIDTHFKDEYLNEVIAQHIDCMNLTYVAITRPKCRLYGYGSMYTTTKDGRPTIDNIGQLLSYVYAEPYSQANETEKQSLLKEEEGRYTYHIEDNDKSLPEEKVANNNSRNATYVSSPIGKRLVLRSRAEDDFAADAPLETIDLGILMHDWLSHIIVWEDAEPALSKMLLAGRMTQAQAQTMREQLNQLKTLIEQNGKSHWFDHSMRVMTEVDILTTTGKTYRPDRIMMQGNHAIIIDYKFGQEHPRLYQEQLRNYCLMLQQMGYTVESHIIYIAQQKIEHINY